MDKEKKEVNVHYIAVVSKQSNGVLELTKEEISNDYKDIIDRLDEMVKNPNRTVLDMQQCFVQAFPRKEFFDICWPRFYDSKYVGGVGYPKIYTYDEYKDLLKSKRESLDLCYSNDREKYKKIESALEDSKARLKIDFKLWCLRYIHGYNFTQTKSKIKNKSQTIMLSEEKIGWTTYIHKANEDVDISIKTNFGYGWSSYFLLAMSYKGIDILPYSALVKYYYANEVELIRCTRQYNLDRDSWNVSFDFVVETANMAKMNPQKFINEFIVNEIDEMVLGLKNTMDNPNEIERFMKRGVNGFNNTNENIPNGFCLTVRNISKTEIEDYGVYRDEMVIAYKAEKITGALLFLEKLSKLAEILPTIQGSIDRIKSLNNRLKPELEEKITRIQNSVEELNEQVKKQRKSLEELEGQLKAVNEKIKPHTENIKKLKEGCKDNEEQKKIEEKYSNDNHDYRELCSEKEKLQQEKEELQNKIYKLNRHIEKRKAFINRLEVCRNNIQEYLSVA